MRDVCPQVVEILEAKMTNPPRWWCEEKSQEDSQALERQDYEEMRKEEEC